MKMAISIRDPGKLEKHLRDMPAFRDAQRHIVERGVGLVLRRTRERAPGSLANEIEAGVKDEQSQGGYRVLIGRVRVGDRTRGSFRYPWALQASKKVRYRYRSGPRQGKLTKAWFSGARTGLRSELTKLLAAAVGEIKAAW